MLKSSVKVSLCILFACCMTFLVTYGIAQLAVPKLTQRVNDFTNTLSAQEKQELENLLKSYEDTTSTQIVVLIINSLEGESIEEYANKKFALNKIGQVKKDNGVLLVIAKQDHKLRIEVGYGLEGVLTDALTSRIIREEIRPRFKENNYFGGIVTGVDAIIRAARGEYRADNKGKKAPAVSMGLIFLVVIFGIFLLPMLSSRRRSIIGSNGHQYYSGWGYGGGGFSGSSGFGGSGGFSGGGGMSGGGGASGSW